MSLYRVYMTVKECKYIDVDVKSREEAIKRAEEADGSEFSDCSDDPYWEVDEVEALEEDNDMEDAIYFLGVGNEVDDDGKHILRGEEIHAICKAKTVEEARARIYKYFDDMYDEFEYEIDDEPITPEGFKSFFDDYCDGDESIREEWFKRFDKEPVFKITDKADFAV